jgi:hypothetical protein
MFMECPPQTLVSCVQLSPYAIRLKELWRFFKFLETTVNVRQQSIDSLEQRLGVGSTEADNWHFKNEIEALQQDLCTVEGWLNEICNYDGDVVNVQQRCDALRQKVVYSKEQLGRLHTQVICTLQFLPAIPDTIPVKKAVMPETAALPSAPAVTNADRQQGMPCRALPILLPREDSYFEGYNDVCSYPFFWLVTNSDVDAITQPGPFPGEDANSDQVPLNDSTGQLVNNEPAISNSGKKRKAENEHAASADLYTEEHEWDIT